MKIDFTNDDLDKLSIKQQGPCVSIYMETPNVKTDNDKLYIVLKNTLFQIEKELTILKTKRETIDHFMTLTKQFFKDGAASQKLDKSIAIFFSNEKLYGYSLPFKINNRFEIGDSFYLEPLENYLKSKEKIYYILSLSQKDVTFYQATPYSMVEIPLPKIAKSLKEYLATEEYDQSLQYHTKAPKSKVKRDAIFYSSGDKKADDKKNQLQRYFLEIDEAIFKKLNKKKNPLILIGTEYLFPIYKKVNSYPYLLRRGVTGSPDKMKKETIHQETLKIINL